MAILYSRSSPRRQSINQTLPRPDLTSCSLSETCLDWLVRPETKMAHLRSLLIEPNAMLPCTHHEGRYVPRGGICAIFPCPVFPPCRAVADQVHFRLLSVAGESRHCWGDHAIFAFLAMESNTLLNLLTWDKDRVGSF
jgi:hypothetical protein